MAQARDKDGQFASGGGGGSGKSKGKSSKDITSAVNKAFNISNKSKIDNAATMFGTGSKQHLAAKKRFGGK